VKNRYLTSIDTDDGFLGQAMLKQMQAAGMGGAGGAGGFEGGDDEGAEEDSDDEGVSS